MSATASMFDARVARRMRLGRWFAALCAFFSAIGLIFLCILLGRVAYQSWGWLSIHFLTEFPSTIYPEKAGMKSAIWGSIWLLVITGGVAVPVGVAAAVYLEEYAKQTRLNRIIELNIANLAGVPSIVYGLLGLGVFVRALTLNRSLIAGGLTLSLLVLPVIIIASREAIRAVPRSFRLAAFALGATRWQTIRAHTLPAALPGIMTGVILALSRAIGEAAPLIPISAITYITFVPRGLSDPFTAMPLQIYAWSDTAQVEFHHLAAAGILVLLAVLLPMNALAIGVRAWHQRRKAW